MSRTKKILLISAASVAGIIAILVVASLIIVQTSWFSDFVRGKLVATMEESTGGTVEIGSFHFDPWSLTITVRNFVLHGTEPKTDAPLASIPLLQIQLKLLSGIAHVLDIANIQVEQPHVDLIVFPDGKTNIPQPKVPSTSSNSNGLQTIVDLKIGHFQLDNGLIQYAQQKSEFSGRGDNLHAVLNYNTVSPSYSGFLAIDPLIFTQNGRPPVDVHVNLPVNIEGNGVTLTNGTLATAQSKIAINASLQNIKAPVISAKVNVIVNLPEMQRSFDLPLDTSSPQSPHELTAELAARIDEGANSIQLQTAHLALGQTTFQGSGTLQDPNNPNAAAEFNANLDLPQLARLMKVTSVQANGAVVVNGNAKVDKQNNYQVNGTINSRGLSLRQDGTAINNVSLYTPFHADPYLISLDGLKLNAFGGSLAAKIFVEKMQNLSVEGNLHNFSLPVLAATFTGKHLGYDGTLNGSLDARGDLKAKGTTGFGAKVNLAITPGTRGVPISGRLNVDYAGAANTVNLFNSYVALPHTRLDLAGELNKQLTIGLVSHNLNDFLPAANFSAKQPETSLPVTLQPGGAAVVNATVTGNLSAPQLAGNAAVTNFALQGKTFNRLALNIAALPSGAAISNGVLTRNQLAANFDASIGLRKWTPVPSSPLAANLTVRNAGVPDLLALANETSIPATGTLTADAHIHGTYANPLGSAVLQVSDGSAYNERFNRIYANINLANQLITLNPLELSTDAGSIDVNATYHHPSSSFMVGDASVKVQSTGIELGKLKQLQAHSPGLAGAVQIAADAALTVREVKEKPTVDIQSVNADVSARGVKVNNQNAGDLTLTARTVNRQVNYQLASNFAGSNIGVNGHTDLASDYPTTADASVQNLSIAKALSIAGQGTIPATGTLSANAHVNGTVAAPNADLTFTLADADVYQERIRHLTGKLNYSPTQINVPSLELSVPAGTMNVTASFNHPAGNLNAGAIAANVRTSNIDLSRIHHLHEAQPTLAGDIHLAADLAANVSEQKGTRSVMVKSVNADFGTKGLSLNGHDLGQASLVAKTSGTTVNYRFDSDIAKSSIHAQGHSQLVAGYPTAANLTFANIRYSNLAPFVSTSAGPAPFDALLEGNASVNGPVGNPDDLKARLELTHLQANTIPGQSVTGGPPSRTVTIQNQGPVLITLNNAVVDIQHFQLTGPETTMNASGSFNFHDKTAPINVNLNAALNLAILQDISREFYSSGTINMNAAVHGDLNQPLVNGRITLKDANINYAEAPNGISNANGTILLSGTGAVIQNLTAQSGGGNVTVTGFAGYSGRAVAFNLKAGAKNVRVRYSGISINSNATITLTGNNNRSLLSGNVLLTRIAYNSASDAGSLLSSFSSTPPSVPSAPNPILTGLHLDIHILTVPELRVITTYADRLSVQANLTVRGTAATPGMLGRVVVTEGDLVFFGNTYTVNTGTINFYDPSSIQPILNISLETLAQGVDVTLTVSGTMDNLQLSYSSDPPLQFEQIVELLATNTTPDNPNIAANQPVAPQQSFTQMGESAILGQAVADPLASRLKRVFGLSEFKIDPSVAGSNGQPTARVTLQQKIANNITFTYITDLTQSNSEIVRVQWDLTPKLSAVGLRDYNGNVSVELFYKFTKQ